MVSEAMILNRRESDSSPSVISETESWNSRIKKTINTACLLKKLIIEGASG